MNQGDKVWRRQGSADEFSPQTCQQILPRSGRVAVGLIAMVTGRVGVPSSPPTTAASRRWLLQPLPFSIPISFAPRGTGSTWRLQSSTRPAHHRSLFYQPQHLSVSHPLGQGRLGVDTGREPGRDEPPSKADAERSTDDAVAGWTT